MNDTSLLAWKVPYWAGMTQVFWVAVHGEDPKEVISVLNWLGDDDLLGT